MIKKKKFYFLTTISYAIIQPCLGLAKVQDDQFTCWRHGYPKSDSNEMYTHPTAMKDEKCEDKKGVARAPCTFQALPSQQTQ